MKEEFPVVVIGGGPAGMTAAIFAAKAGATVILLEKNTKLGVKLRITGGGRCNITNNTPNVRDLLHYYGPAGKFLFSPFAQCDVPQSRDWFASLRVDTVEENERRVFPVSQSAEAVTEALVHEVEKQKVTVITKVSATSLVKKKDGHFVVQYGRDKEVLASSVVVATGGTSRPETGSTGDALPWLRALGHTVEKPTRALVPIATKEAWSHALAGVTLPDCGLVITSNGERLTKVRGKLLFTHVGLSGPTILNLSKQIGDELSYGYDVVVSVNLKPDVDAGSLDHELVSLLSLQSNKLVRNVLPGFIPNGLVLPLLTLAEIDLDTPAHSLRVGERKKLRMLMQALPLTVSHLLGADKAVVSSGGVALPEVDFRTMESRLVPGLYLIGDVLNIDRPSGGFSLQLCWTTGTVAGQAVGKGNHTH